MSHIPTDRPTTLPGEILLHEFIEPMGLSQSEVAESIGVSFQRLNGVVNGRRDLTASTALRLARYFGTTPEFWINLQRSVDLYEAMREEGSEIASIEPLADTA